jgi:hypothetical protein
MPYSLRFRVAFDSALMGEVLRIFVCAVFAWLRMQALENGIPKWNCGSVTFVQSFGSALNCHLSNAVAVRHEIDLRAFNRTHRRTSSLDSCSASADLESGAKACYQRAGFCAMMPAQNSWAGRLECSGKL